MTGTLREFAPIEPVRLFFDYPLHRPDVWNFLAEAKNDQMVESGRGVGKGQMSKTTWASSLEEAYDACGGEGRVPLREIVGYIQKNGIPKESTIRKNISQSQFFDLYTDRTSGGRFVIKRD
jgi:hypothetical protein